MRRVILASLLAAALEAAGCNSAPTTPFSPSTLVSTGRAGAASGSWQLTTTLTSVAGPPVCFDQRDAVGARADVRLDVRRDGESITLLYDLADHPADHIELVGTVLDGRFEGLTSWVGHEPCAGSDMGYRFESYVTGAISEDGRSITASERWTYRFSPDQAVVLWFAWEAERP